MKLYAHVPQEHDSDYRRSLWNQILQVAEIDEEEDISLFEYSE
jgi:hypothetical protein